MDPSPAYEAEVASVDVAVARLAWRQHGVVTRQQMEQLGLRGSAIDRRVRKAGLRRAHRGVYVVGAVRLTDPGRWLAAVLACGSDAVLSHFAAAALWDLQRAPATRIDVTAPGKREVQGVRCHVARSLSDEDVATIDGIPVTSLNRTALDLAELLPAQRLRSTLETAQRRDLLDVRSLDALIVRSRGHRGVKPLKAALAQLRDEAPWTQSELERRFLELIRSAGLGEPSVNVVVAGELVDFHWPQSRVVVEVDGYASHNGRRSFEEDRRRDAKLQLAGERVIRVTYRQMEHAARSLVVDLHRLLGSTAA